MAGKLHIGSALSRLGKTAGQTLKTSAKLAKGEPYSPKMLREFFESMGATYIKLGQLIASSPSLFPESYVAEFQNCLDQTTPVPFSYIEQVLTEELGDIGACFAQIQTKPLASASIAQVHAATLLSGDEVVIKVQKPGIETIINTDLGLLELSFGLAERVVPKLKHASLAGILKEIRRAMVLEADFNQEAANIAEFQAFLDQTDNSQVVAPKVFSAYSSRRVLTMSRLNGVPMLDPQVMKQYTKDPAEVLSNTLNVWFQSLMMAPSFHADLHAGNLLLLSDGKVGFIDFGIVGRIDKDKLNSAVALFGAINQSDYSAMATHMLGMGMTKGEVNVGELALDLKEVFEKVLGEPGAGMVGDSEMSQIMQSIAKTGERHGIRFPRDFALLLKQFLYFDRFMRIVMPEGELFDEMGFM